MYLFITLKYRTYLRLKFTSLDAAYLYLSTKEWIRFKLNSELPTNFSEEEFTKIDMTEHV